MDFHPGRLSRLEQTVRRHVRGFAGAGFCRSGRAEDAKLPAGLVFGGGRTVGIEQVPLVEDGVRDGARQAESCVHGTGSPAPASSPSIAASQEISPRTALYLARAANTSRSRRIQPWLGKNASISARHTATGIA